LRGGGLYHGEREGACRCADMKRKVKGRDNSKKKENSMLPEGALSQTGAAGGKFRKRDGKKKVLDEKERFFLWENLREGGGKTIFSHFLWECDFFCGVFKRKEEKSFQSGLRGEVLSCLYSGGEDMAKCQGFEGFE